MPNIKLIIKPNFYKGCEKKKKERNLAKIDLFIIFLKYYFSRWI